MRPCPAGCSARRLSGMYFDFSRETTFRSEVAVVPGTRSQARPGVRVALTALGSLMLPCSWWETQLLSSETLVLEYI